VASVLERGREAYRAGRWADARDALEATPRGLRAPEDWERLAVCAYLTGRDEESAAAWESAYYGHLGAGHPAEGARCAFWLALGLLMRGNGARANGWFSRSRTALEEGGILECPASGYLLIAAMLGALGSGDAAGAMDLAVQAAGIGDRHGDPDLRALGTLGHGQALLALGETAGGTAKLDEAMVAVAAGEAGPVTTGIVYCAVIVECMSALDLARASEWTTALSAWCEAQPDLVPYRGQCLVHRSEVLQLSGKWREAVREAQLACELLATPAHPALGRAMYQLGELHRLCGRADEAEASYAGASACGHYPQPGLALLRLRQGRVDAAVTAIRSAAAETTEGLARARILPAYVEILLAAGDVADARRAADELTATASELGSPTLRAVAAHAAGAVLLAEGDAVGALEALHDAAEEWQALEARYEGARTQVLVGLARRQLGDEDAARLDLAGARSTLAGVGAVGELAALDRVAGQASPAAGGLSPREVEVLRLVATGRTNVAIAADLVLSERTVDRHVSNILAKLGLPSRSAATAWAYEQHLV